MRENFLMDFFRFQLNIEPEQEGFQPKLMKIRYSSEGEVETWGNSISGLLGARKLLICSFEVLMGTTKL